MKKPKTKVDVKLLMALMFFTSTMVCSAQIRLNAFRVAALNEAVTLPSYKVIKLPIHPGALIGVDLWQKTTKHWTKTMGVDLSYYYHNLYEHATMLDAAYTLGYKFNFGLQTKLLTNVGYKQSFLTGDVFKFKNGDYERVYLTGQAQLNIKLGLGLEYPVNEKWSITTDYKFMLAMPYAPKSGKPFATHSLFGLGIKINLVGNGSKTVTQ